MSQDFFDAAPSAEAFEWTPTRTAGLKQLAAFVPAGGNAYARQRNFDLGQQKHHHVSKLSAWIRHRLILEEEVLSAIFQSHTHKSAEKFIQEVFWRGYFKGWLEHRPDVWRYYRHDVIQLFNQLEKDAGLSRRYDEAVSGRTGIVCFDAWILELVETGYLHNHARMWFASIWIYTLRLPWQLGADFFYRHLIDGDPASNTCSWRWVCGLHTLGKTYLARASNIEKYTNGRFVPFGELAASAPPIEDPRQVTVSGLNVTSPEIIGRRLGLAITEEDCSVESLAIPDLNCVLALTDGTKRSVRGTGSIAKSFTKGAIQDAIARAERALGLPATSYAGDDWSEGLRAWVSDNQLEAVVTPKLTLGPVSRRFRKACQAASVEHVEIIRSYDTAVWPHAKRGFFGLKKKIPQILNEIGLENADARPATLI